MVQQCLQLNIKSDWYIFGLTFLLMLDNSCIFVKIFLSQKNLGLFLLPVSCVEFLVGLGFWGVYDVLAYFFVFF